MWVIFYYYAKRQHNRDGLLKLRKEITESYMSSYDYQDHSNDSMSSEDTDRVDAAALQHIDRIVDTLSSAKFDASDSLHSNHTGTLAFPSPIYNHATSDKYDILSPATIVQMLRDFDILNSSNDYSYIVSLHALLVGVIQECIHNVSDSKNVLGATASSAQQPVPRYNVTSSRQSLSSRQSFFGISGNHNKFAPKSVLYDENDFEEDEEPPQLVVPVAIIVSFTNYMLFQKVRRVINL